MFLRGFFKKIGSLFSGKGRKRRDAKTSNFARFLDGLEPGSEEYALAAEVASLCDESVSVVGTRLVNINRMKLLDEQLEELKCYALMGDDATRLKALLDRFVSAGRDKNQLKYQITGFNSSIVRMETLETDATAAVGEIKDAEEKRKIFEQDLGYLYDEKDGLAQERESLIKGEAFLHRFSIGLVVLFSLFAATIIALHFIFDINIFLPLVLMSVLMGFTYLMLIAARRKIKRDLKMNVLKQKKAVGMINKKSAVYAHYANFLDYSYRKYKVNGSEMLKSNLKDYENYKHLTKRYDALRSIMTDTEREISELLRKHKINNVSMSLENFAKTFNIDNKIEYYNDLSRQKKSIEKDLSTLDARQEQLWARITVYDAADEAGHIKSMIQSYMQHVSGLIEKPAEPVGPPQPENKEAEEQAAVLTAISGEDSAVNTAGEAV